MGAESNLQPAMVSPTAIVHPNVALAEGVIIEDYTIVGVPPRGIASGELKTTVGRSGLIRSHSVIYAGTTIGANFQTGHGVLVRESNRILDNVSVGTHSIIEHHVQIANSVRIHSNVFIPEYSILEQGVWVGPGVVFTNARYPLGDDVKDILEGPHLLQDAKIGANATLLPGVIIGRDSLVGAGSVVVRDVPDGKVVVGNPARVINDVGRLSAYERRELLHENQEQ